MLEQQRWLSGERRASSAAAAPTAPGDPGDVLDAGRVQSWIGALGDMDHAVPDHELIEQLRALEELKAAAAAAQCRATVALRNAVTARHAASGLPRAARGRGVAAQVALARRYSPHRGGRHLGLAAALVEEMPHTLAALADGRLSEWRATVLVRETAHLSREHRAAVDAELCADPDVLEGAGDRAVAARARAAGYRLDPHAATRRARRAVTERRVSLRPAPDTMTHLSALLPVADGVAAFAALLRAADGARASGDPRSRGQVMADTLVERVTGRAATAQHAEPTDTEHADPAEADPAEPAEPAEPAGHAGHDLMVHLVITDRALWDGDAEPALIPGYGPVPAPHARDLIRRHGSELTEALGSASRRSQVFLRRLFTHPSTGELVAMESRARGFPLALRRLLVARDQTCRTPWCGAPIRHGDHTVPHAAGGATDADNGQGLCEACNYAKETPGFTARAGPDSRPGHHRIHITTPTGHTYVSRPPPLPGAA